VMVFFSNFEILMVHKKLVKDWAYVPKDKSTEVDEQIY